MKNARRTAAKKRLEQLLSASAITEGMYVRPWGDHLVLGRHEVLGPDGELEPDDRVRLTARNATTYGLSVRRHTGRWEKTPFTGTLEELTDVICAYMQHIVAPYF
jgi:hypothetical protein